MAHVNHVPLAAGRIAKDFGAVQAAAAPPYFLVQIFDQTV